MGRGALVLVDIDGTLLHGPPRAHTRAIARGLTEVHGVPVSEEDIRAIGPAGRTDREIARMVLRRHGVDDATITAGMGSWIARAVEAFPAIDRDLPPPEVAPDAAAALARMRAGGARLALLSGNLEPIAHAKMARARLGAFFCAGQGAFGSDDEDRCALVPIARARAARGDGAGPVVVIGDTPRDVACARAGGALCVAVTTGPFGADAMTDADAVASGLTEAAEIVLAWRAG